MQATSNNGFIIGIFKKELKNRFLCEVSICGEDVVCYVPSSCHLSNFLKLEGKQVLLVPTQSVNAKTKYALFAVRYRNSYILLNTSMANRAIEDNIHKRRFGFLGKRKSIKKEYTVHDYKADLYLLETDTIIEIKSIISTDKTACFPSVYSERTISQLKSLQELLKQGKRTCFFIVSLCPTVQTISLDRGSEFYKVFMECVRLGMKVSAYACRLVNEDLVITRTILLDY